MQGRKSTLSGIELFHDTWNRATFLGIRESLCEEWQPTGGLELSLIDNIAQCWLMIQIWMEKSARRSTSYARIEHPDFVQWKEWRKEANAKQWINGSWDAPTVSEQSAIEHAAQMVDRWQKMYLRAIRSLRDLRRYSPPVTINNPQQVNIAADGGKQINVSGTNAPERIEAAEIKQIETLND